MIRICAGDPSNWLRQYRGQKPLFVSILSFTETGLISHISAAGRTSQARRYTALVDGELLVSGSTRYALPQLTAGISPAVISRALLTRQKIPLRLFSTGLPDALSVDHIALPQVFAKSVHTGEAMSLFQVEALLESGLHWGAQLAQHCLGSYLIVGECVVGGTTTAQAVLTALGYDVAGRMSSSHAFSNHAQKQTLVSQGLKRWQQSAPPHTVLSAIAAVGDPMQVVAAGMALAASRQVGVLLAGGAQMLAVYAIAQALSNQNPFDQNRHTHPPGTKKISWEAHRVVVGTTRWVIDDESADTQAIAQAIGAPYLASEINFSQSQYVQLRAYEQGFVKEGVGAGGCAIAAHLYQGWNGSQIRHAVEAELRRCL